MRYDERMPKYDAFKKWFIAKCSEVRMPYEEFSPLARRIMRIEVPRATYDMQRRYLRHRTAEQMADLDTASLASVCREPVNSNAAPQSIPLQSRFGMWLVGRCSLAAMPHEEFRLLARRLLGIDVSEDAYAGFFENLRAAL
jgi:hypothetical protein